MHISVEQNESGATAAVIGCRNAGQECTDEIRYTIFTGCDNSRCRWRYEPNTILNAFQSDCWFSEWIFFSHWNSGSGTSCGSKDSLESYDPSLHRTLDHPTSNTETMIHLLKGNIGTGILGIMQMQMLLPIR